MTTTTTKSRSDHDPRTDRRHRQPVHPRGCRSIRDPARAGAGPASRVQEPQESTTSPSHGDARHDPPRAAARHRGVRFQQGKEGCSRPPCRTFETRTLANYKRTGRFSRLMAEITFQDETSTRVRATIARLAEVIDRAGLSMSQAAEIGGIGRATLWRWLKFRKRTVPSAIVGVITAIESHSLTRLRLQESHHLYYDPSRGWQFRCTVSVGNKVVGKRIKQSLKTHDMMEAIGRREVVMANLKSLGLQITTHPGTGPRKNRRPAGPPAAVDAPPSH